MFGIGVKQANKFTKVICWRVKKRAIDSLTINSQDFGTDIGQLSNPILGISFLRQEYGILDESGQEVIVVGLYTRLMECYYWISLGLRFLNSVMMF
jgi:hypothetical protein